MRILTIIPCYNAEKYIRKVVNDIKKYNKHILVVDDGSIDNSYAIVKGVEGIKVIRHEKNRGKGAALKTGFRYALKNNFDAVMTVDADGQHKPSDIHNFLMNFDCADILIGNRMYNRRNMPLRRVLSNTISSYLVSKICKQKINDSQSGYRLIKSKILKNIDLELDDYQLETEILLKASKKGFKIKEIPIETIYGEEVSHINPFLVTLRFFRTITKR